MWFVMRGFYSLVLSLSLTIAVFSPAITQAQSSSSALNSTHPISSPGEAAVRAVVVEGRISEHARSDGELSSRHQYTVASWQGEGHED